MNHRKKLIENFFSLSVLQGANYILPLVTVPYLVRVLGPEKFGLIAFAQAFAQYFRFLTDYGFNFSATKEISINRENKHKIREIFSAVVSAKILLFLISLLIFSLIVLLVGRFRQDLMIYFVSLLGVFGSVLFFQWFFQGVEQMKYITILNIIAKLAFVVCIFVFVRQESDYILAALFHSLGFVLAGLISVYVVWSHFKMRYIIPSIDSVVREVKNGYYIFISQIANSLYTTSNVFILGLLTNNLIVGYYSAGEKLIKAVQALFNPVSQAIFPHVSFLAMTSKEFALRFVRKVTILSGVVTFGLSVIIFIFAPQIVQLVLGDQYLPSIIVVRILSFLPFICSLGNIFGTQIMINFGMSRTFARVITIAGILNVVLAFILVPYLKHVGIAIAVLITESLISLAMFVILEIKQLSPRRKWL